MSLMLRKNNQDVLDSYGLSDFHVEIDDGYYKTLQIVGGCGKPLVSVPGIRFTRTQPTKVEIEYATELFMNFMDIHGKLIQTYVVKAKILAAKDELPKSLGKFTVQKITESFNNVLKSYRLDFIDGPLKYSYDISPNMKKVTFYSVNIAKNANIKTAPSQFTKYTDNVSSLVKEGKKFIKWYYDRKKETEAVEKLHAEISTCNV